MQTTASEIRSAHLSCFAYESPESGVGLLETALAGAARKGLRHLFVAVPAADATDFVSHFGEKVDVVAPATVFRHRSRAWLALEHQHVGDLI